MTKDPQAGDGTRTTEATGPGCRTRPRPPMLDESRVIRYDGAGWDGVRIQPYKADAEEFDGVTRRLLAAPDAAGYAVRYFEVDPGGRTSLERHEHVHVIVCLRGRGRVELGADGHDVGFGDIVYVAPNDPHRFLNPTDAPFGFVCVVDQERDRPTRVR